MILFFFLCLALQALLMVVDEFWFHHRRGLGRWERLGHPVDTLSVILCFAVVGILPYSEGSFWLYSFLAAFSCLLITKDEWVHARECLPTEHWLHSVLFILHPLIFIFLGSLYAQGSHFGELKLLVQGQGYVLVGFFCYQILYWNFIRKGPLYESAQATSKLSE